MANSKLDKHPKAKKFLISLFKFIFIGYIFAFILWYVIDKYAYTPASIYDRIGNNVAVSVPIKQTLQIREYAIKRYVYYCQTGDFESAYSMLTDEYKAMVSFDTYKTLISNIDWESFELEELKAKSDYCFEAHVVYREAEEVVHTTYLLYTTKYNTENFKISPDKFIFGYYNQKVKNDGILLEVQDCFIFIDKVILRAKIKNTSLLSDVHITSINASYNAVMNKREPVDYVLKHGEEKDITIEYKDLTYFMPNSVQIEKEKDENTIKKLLFELKSEQKH